MVSWPEYPNGESRGINSVDAAVPGDQIASSGRDSVLPDGRLLRDVLRRRRSRVENTRAYPDIAQQWWCQRGTAGGSPGKSRWRVPATLDPARIPRLDL